jgi:hypothetical protein
MDKKINYIHLSKIRLLPVIFLLLCSCVVFAQMPTELITNPNLPPKIEKPQIATPSQKNTEKKEKESKKESEQPTNTTKKTGLVFCYFVCLFS